MSQENVEIALQLIGALQRRDVDALVALVSQDVEWEDPVFWSEPARIYRGRAELREWFDRSWNPGKASKSRSRSSPKPRMIGFSLGGSSPTRGKGSGAETQLRGWFVVWIANGKITRRQVFLDRDEALGAAGCGSRRGRRRTSRWYAAGPTPSRARQGPRRAYRDPLP
jgi:ketosteroid isomerase-like protein